MNEKHLSERAYAKHRAPLVIENIVQNVGLLRRLRIVTRSPRSGGSLTVVGAGPSFDLAGVFGPVLACNTAARRVCSERAGGVVVVVREALDVSEQIVDLQHKPDLIVCDIATNPRVIEAAIAEVGEGRVALAIPATMDLFWLSAELHEEPLYAGSAALTLGVALAERWGATSVHLAGVDLAYVGDRVYADGTLYEQERVSVSGGAASVTGQAAHVELHARTGHVPPPNEPRVFEVPAREGGSCWTYGPWRDQIEWLENFAQRRSGMRLTRTGGAAALVGWRDAPSDRSDFAGYRTRDVDPAIVDTLEREIARQIEHAQRLAGEGRLRTRCPDLLAGAQFVETHSAGDLFAVDDWLTAGRISDEQSIDAAYQIIGAHAVALAQPKSSPSSGTPEKP